MNAMGRSELPAHRDLAVTGEIAEVPGLADRDGASRAVSGYRSSAQHKRVLPRPSQSNRGPRGGNGHTHHHKPGV
jgi:hypothetical protein